MLTNTSNIIDDDDRASCFTHDSVIGVLGDNLFPENANSKFKCLRAQTQKERGGGRASIAHTEPNLQSLAGEDRYQTGRPNNDLRFDFWDTYMLPAKGNVIRLFLLCLWLC